MDNAGCHPPNVVDKYSNIKVVFLPANTTSKLQPLDLGIIMNFKTCYRKLFMRYIVTKCSTATEIVKSIRAIQWIAVITKCFRKAGILDNDLNVVVQQQCITVDPFLDLDPQTDTELLDLMQQTHGDDHCSFETFVSHSDCFDMDNPQVWTIHIGNKIFLENLVILLSQLVILKMIMAMTMMMMMYWHHHL